MKRHCCDEQCEQGRDCPDRVPVDFVDWLVVGFCSAALLGILIVRIVRG